MKLKKLLLPILALGLMVGIGTGISCQSIQPVYAAEEETTEVSPTTEDPSVIKEVKNYFETVILPAVIASSSTIIITTIGSVAKWLMTKAKDKHITEQVDKGAEEMLEIKNQCTAIALELTNKLKEIIEEVKKSIEDNKQLNKVLSHYEKEISALPFVESKIDELIQIEARLASIDKEAVSKGVAEEINKIVEKYKK